LLSAWVRTATAVSVRDIGLSSNKVLFCIDVP
jgi:hypothetical protein